MAWPSIFKLHIQTGEFLYVWYTFHISYICHAWRYSLILGLVWFYMLSHTPIVLRGWGFCLWIALGRFKICNEYSLPIHASRDVAVRVQTAWRHNAATCSNNGNNIATASSATSSPCRVSLNGKFHQDSSTQWSKLRIWKICSSNYIKLTRQKSFNSVYTIICVW